MFYFLWKMAIGKRPRSIVCLVSVQILLIFSASWPGAEGLTFPQQYTIMHWARRIEQEIDRVFQHITGAQQLKGVSVSFEFLLITVQHKLDMQCSEQRRSVW
ncbi:hypothetical protein GOODEAATRI_004424 [Goodea atripinnis]|uniref:Uncharacterized protein n=1 Tax=Goodea atripinnis TaxID=208336 RepID=A0ABV0MP97_9TELE